MNGLVVYVDDFGVTSYFGENGDVSREKVAYFVREAFEAMNEVNRVETMVNELDVVWNPAVNEKVSLSINANDPVFRQLTVDLYHTLDFFDVDS